MRRVVAALGLLLVPALSGCLFDDTEVHVPWPSVGDEVSYQSTWRCLKCNETRPNSTLGVQITPPTPPANVTYHFARAVRLPLGPVTNRDVVEVVTRLDGGFNLTFYLDPQGLRVLSYEPFCDAGCHFHLQPSPLTTFLSWMFGRTLRDGDDFTVDVDGRAVRIAATYAGPDRIRIRFPGGGPDFENLTLTYEHGNPYPMLVRNLEGPNLVSSRMEQLWLRRGSGPDPGWSAFGVERYHCVDGPRAGFRDGMPPGADTDQSGVGATPAEMVREARRLDAALDSAFRTSSLRGFSMGRPEPAPTVFQQQLQAVVAAGTRAVAVTKTWWDPNPAGLPPSYELRSAPYGYAGKDTESQAAAPTGALLVSWDAALRLALPDGGARTMAYGFREARAEAPAEYEFTVRRGGHSWAIKVDPESGCLFYMRPRPG